MSRKAIKTGAPARHDKTDSPYNALTAPTRRDLLKLADAVIEGTVTVQAFGEAVEAYREYMRGLNAKLAALGPVLPFDQ